MTTGKKLLIVDDDPDLLKMAKKQLEHYGFECRCLTSVETALKTLKDIRPDLILLDLGFTNANGTAFLEHISEWLPSDCKIPPVIVLSGIYDKEVVDYTMERGAAAFVAKPYDISRLIATINQHIS